MARSKKRLSFNINDSLTDRGYLPTEQTNILSSGIDQLSTNQLVNLFSEEDKKPQIAVKGASFEISEAIDKIIPRISKGGKIFYIGAGTSGRLGVLDAAECPPTFCTPPELVQGVIAGGYDALFSSAERIEDDLNAGQIDLQTRGFSKKDSLIGIMAGGTTPYVHGALSFGKEISALTIAISCVPKDVVFIPCDVDIRLVTGPELLAGSTRLKAATATKMALNIISTSVMIRLGKVYGNRMIDLSISNTKLLDRSLRILKELVQLERADAFQLLERCDGSVKLSLLVHTSKLSVEECRNLLKLNANNLRQTLAALGLPQLN
ncbi:N-acetylmuramic acid 6-phosphate etherase [Prochlorococcus sp. MIT 1341]|uniref:N-acetylmuramic acid 6-phosphate etherase n=1 Tax=Prochlorococcus sp. MIT 1341 TaxID=3096221 RepID=UPI002A7665C7|nr:N-acetylmuramic acid 6-phosphate etherase [Prochlorococcus sp. MIT 1341]